MEPISFFQGVEPSQADTLVPDDLSQPAPLRRLRRGQAPSTEPEESQDTRGPAVAKTAFDLLMAKKPKDPERTQKRKERAREVNGAFVQDQANESDEDALFGFGTGAGGDEDEDDDEEHDKVVEGLVDDAKMDAEIENADAVLEKAL